MSSSQSSHEGTKSQVALPKNLQGIPGLADHLNPDEKVTVSTLAEAFLKAQMDTYDCLSQQQEEESSTFNKAPSLSAIAAGKINQVLEASDNLQADVTTIAKSLNSTTLRQVLTNPRTFYRVVRAFLALPPEFGPGNAAETSREAVDVDELVQHNEKFIRSRGAEANKDSKHLVTLEELVEVLGGSPRNTETPVRYRRQDPPKGGFETLDYHRKSAIEILPNSEAFSNTFERITREILKGLNWDNVFIAGGMVLTTLMHTNPSEDGAKNVRECDIDLYLYGLNAQEANAKLEEIYAVWCANLPPMNQQKLVVKNAKTVTFLADYPNRRIQIVLKLLPSPTQVLLNFDLDACALGFDGKKVMMLPRCARAIETGYSTFTMDLIWGHHLGDRRATQEVRVWKYADRGFGIRILPSYAKSLEDDTLIKRTLGSKADAEFGPMFADDSANSPWVSIAETQFDTLLEVRKPGGPEPGLKTLKRIAYLGIDYVKRFYFGFSPLAKPSEYVGPFNGESYEEAEEKFKEMQESNARRRAAGELLDGPSMLLGFMDTDDAHRQEPYGRKGLGEFELFMRHCEAWRLDARGDAALNRSQLASTVYDADTYDDSPQYNWGAGFKVEDFAKEIDDHNGKLFGDLRQAICDRLGIGFQRSGYSGYLTRRIRRQIYGPDLASVQERQITIPLAIPYDLENYLLRDLPNSYKDLPEHYTSNPTLIPVHKPASPNQPASPLPPLRDDVSERGNLRYWVVTNESMWAGQHPVIDETAEILWALFHMFGQQNTLPASHEIFEEIGLGTHLARNFSRRRLLADLNSSSSRRSSDAKIHQQESTDKSHSNRTSTTESGLSTREALLFRPWVMKLAVYPYRHYTQDSCGCADWYDEHSFEYPVPDKLFWTDGDEGDWEGGKPQWRDVSEEDEEGRESGNGGDRKGEGADSPDRKKRKLESEA